MACRWTFGELFHNQSPWFPTKTTPVALSLLCHLWHEQVDHRLPKPSVPCICLYVLELFMSRYRHLANITDTAIGILFVYETLNPLFVTNGNPAAAQAGLSYFWLSLSVNVILTLTIVIRLVLHNREIRNAIGARHGTSGMYNSLVTMLLESCALYALSSILYIGLFAATSSVTALFFPIHVEVQVSDLLRLPNAVLSREIFI